MEICDLKISDLHGKDWFLVQLPSEVEDFNKQYDVDFAYFFLNTLNNKLYGTYGLLFRDKLVYIGEV